MDVGNGNAQLGAPCVHAVDVYVEVDGAPKEDGHVCFGADANASRAASVAAATKKTLYGEFWMDAFLKDGPKDGSKPWATIVRSERWSDSDGYVYLPLMAKDVDNALMGDDDLTYAHALMAKWAKLLKDVGAGEHEFTISIRPRGVVFEDDDGDARFDAVGGAAGGDAPGAVGEKKGRGGGRGAPAPPAARGVPPQNIFFPPPPPPRPGRAGHARDVDDVSRRGPGFGRGPRAQSAGVVQELARGRG